jgi:hypothetical protein
MVDKLFILKAVRLLSYFCALAMMVDVVIRLCNFHHFVDPFFYLLTFYLIGFAALLVVAELRVKKVLVYVEFLRGRLGKGLYLIVVGLLLFDEYRTSDMTVSLILVIAGILNIIVSCIRENNKGNEHNDFLDIEKNRNFEEEVNENSRLINKRHENEEPFINKNT